MPNPQRFYIVSLGCPKNLVDSTGLASLLEQAGHTGVDTPEEASLIIVNTCGFIEPARAESHQVLQELVQAKRPDQQIIAAGCYAQRSPQDLIKATPGLDGLIGTRHWMEIVPFVEQMAASPAPTLHASLTAPNDRNHRDPSLQRPTLPRVAIQGVSAYLKIADGCRRSCAFCAIPLIKGPAASRPPEAILADARWLAEQGIREINLIAQDTTDYGRDLGMRQGLTHLLEQMVTETPEVDWIRIMYAYPSRIKNRLIKLMARHPQILPYLDIPIQHAHPDVLRRMRRPSDIMQVCRTIERLRDQMPEIALRTTFLVGFPGETEAEFETLLDFVDSMAFDHVGVFTYSHEEGTPAAEMEDDVPPTIKEERRERLMALQQSISLAKNQALIGQTLDVLVEGLGDGLSVGRSYRDGPEIDGLVLVQAELPVGEILPIRITAALEYDLVGELAT